MKSKILISLLMGLVSLSIHAEAFKNKKDYYYGDKIKLIGKKKTIKNYPFLYLENAINVYPKNPNEPDSTDEVEKNIKIIQIARGFDEIIPNGCVILNGDLYHADNANHKTKVLIYADSFRPCGDKK